MVTKIKEFLKKPFVPEGIILAVAFLIRIALLGIKPYHFDEGVNGHFMENMERVGFYKYDPKNYHGPLFFYIQFISITLLGKNVIGMRLPSILASMCSVWLSMKYDRFIGRNAAIITAIVIALSPGDIFYARYAIHESSLTLGLLLTMWGFLGMIQEGSRKYLWATLAGFTSLLLLKETWIIHIAAMILAIPCLLLWTKIVPSSPTLQLAKQTWTGKDLANGLAVSLLSLVFFYSGGFVEPAGLKEPFQTYSAWVTTGTEKNGHDKPWFFWIKTITTYEWASVLGMLYCLRLLLKSSPVLRYLGIYGIGAFIAYSIVPYKTVWCVISLIWPFQLLFGCMIIELWTCKNRAIKALSVALLTLCLSHSIYKAIEVNFFNYSKQNEIYAYVQTSKAFNERFMQPLLDVAKENPMNTKMGGFIAQDAYFPIPWVINNFENIAYVGTNSLPNSINSGFIYAKEVRKEEIEGKISVPYLRVTLNPKNDGGVSYVWLKEDIFLTWFNNKRNQTIVPIRVVPKLTSTPTSTNNVTTPQPFQQKQ